MITAFKQDMITYKAQLRVGEMMKRFQKEYYGSRLGETENGIHGEEGRHLADNSEIVETELLNANSGESVNQVPDNGNRPQNAPNINPAELI